MVDSASPEWREFEILAARMERMLHPLGARVTCPDGIRDIVTGGVREVDASIRIQSPTGETVTSIECRRRHGAQDVTWIEQLVTKRENIGASKTIAVSAEGFTANAIAMAAHYGIELRSFDEFDDDETVRTLVRDTKMTALITEYCLTGIRFYHGDGRPVALAELHDDVRTAIAREPLDATVAFRRGTSDELCARFIARGANDDDVPPDGVEVRKTLSVSLEADTCFVRGVDREIGLSSVEFDFGFTKYERVVPTGRVVDYTDLNVPLVREFHGTAEVTPGDGVGISMTSKPGARFNVHSIGVSMPKELEAADGTPRKNCDRFVVVTISNSG